MRTDDEKHTKAMKHALRYSHDTPPQAGRGRKRSRAHMDDKEPRGKIPVWNMLRPDNQLGGGFHLTKNNRIPAFVETFIDRCLKN